MDSDQTLPWVTVITPAYNRADQGEETIRSVLGQDYPRLEYIVLDDGSTDDTLAAIRRYEGHLRSVSHPNMGEHRPVNRGLELATGEIIGVVNSDDALLPGAISAVVETLAENPDVVVVYPDWDLIDERGEVLRHIPTFDFTYVDMVRWQYCIPGPGAFFRRSVVERIGGRDPTLGDSADFDFWLRAGLLGPFQRIPHTLATLRHHAGLSSVRERGEAMARQRLELLDKFYARPDLPPELLDLRVEAYRNAYLVGAIMLGADPWDEEQRFHFRDRLSERLLGTAYESLHETIGRLHREVAKRDRTVEWLHREVAQRDQTVEWLHREVAERDLTVEWLHGEVAQRDGTIRQRRLALDRLQGELAHRDQAGEPPHAAPTGPADPA